MTEPETRPSRHVPIFRSMAWHTSADAVDVPGTGGWQVGLAPRVMTASDARRRPGTPAPGPRERTAIVERALDLFATGTVDLGPVGRQDAEGFRRAMWETAGLPHTLTDRWCDLLRDAVVAHRVEPIGGRSLVALPANTFTCLDAVCAAALESDEIWIRPSRREPVSALRFAAAMLAAGWPADRISFYPTTAEVLVALVRDTDRQTVFGGDGVVDVLERQSAGSAGLVLHGPGRGCATVHPDADPDTTADWLVRLVAADSGRFCRNVRTILCPGGHDELVERLAVRLDAIDLDGVDSLYPQAAQPSPALAAVVADEVHGQMRPGDRFATTRPMYRTVAGNAYLAPTLMVIGDPGSAGAPHPLLARELPAPFAAITTAPVDLAEAVRGASRFRYDQPGHAAMKGHRG